MDELAVAVGRLLRERAGHFVLESGHHGELWLDLELLCVRPERVAPLAAALAGRLEAHGVEAVCGPLVEGAFVGLMVAAELRVPFTYAERFARADGPALFPFGYRLPPPLGAEVRGKRVAIVNDVVNAGSAVRGAYEALLACGARPVVIGALMVLGPPAGELAAARGLALERLAARESRVWEVAACPLCRAGVPLEDPAQP
jgi:orotate phosphoribosyltransferase